eukprot:PhM_4_TR1913/c0_g3_i1/m.31738
MKALLTTTEFLGLHILPHLFRGCDSLLQLHRRMIVCMHILSAPISVFYGIYLACVLGRYDFVGGSTPSAREEFSIACACVAHFVNALVGISLLRASFISPHVSARKSGISHGITMVVAFLMQGMCGHMLSYDAVILILLLSLLMARPSYARLVLFLWLLNCISIVLSRLDAVKIIEPITCLPQWLHIVFDMQFVLIGIGFAVSLFLSQHNAQKMWERRRRRICGMVAEQLPPTHAIHCPLNSNNNQSKHNNVIKLDDKLDDDSTISTTSSTAHFVVSGGKPKKHVTSAFAPPSGSSESALPPRIVEVLEATATKMHQRIPARCFSAAAEPTGLPSPPPDGEATTVKICFKRSIERGATIEALARRCREVAGVIPAVTVVTPDTVQVRWQGVCDVQGIDLILALVTEGDGAVHTGSCQNDDAALDLLLRVAVECSTSVASCRSWAAGFGSFEGRCIDAVRQPKSATAATTTAPTSVTTHSESPHVLLAFEVLASCPSGMPNYFGDQLVSSAATISRATTLCLTGEYAQAIELLDSLENVDVDAWCAKSVVRLRQKALRCLSGRQRVFEEAVRGD